MAWTITYKNDVTSKRVRLIHALADAATYSIETGLKVIEHLSYAPKSLTTIVGLKFYTNSNASGVSTPGTIGCSGFTSGDEIYFTVYGH